MESQSYLLPWNDAVRLEELFVEHGDDIAAVIMEPVCVNGGGVMPAPGYLQRVRQLCDHHQVVLIFDEIITGFRMGLGGAQEMFGVTPDLTTLGKAIAGGGVPVSALVGRADIMKLLVDKKVIHAGTFNGYPLGTAAVKATLQMLGRNGGEAMNRMNHHAEMIHDILTREAAKAGLPLVVQGPAGCASYHCCTEELSSTADYTFELMSFDILLNGKLAEHGILVSTLSRMYPNIMLDMKDVAWFSERVPAAIAEMKEIYDELV
jgi:glutamate-1-semialdehyde 2,1-aminomutase